METVTGYGIFDDIRESLDVFVCSHRFSSIHCMISYFFFLSVVVVATVVVVHLLAAGFYLCFSQCFCNL